MMIVSAFMMLLTLVGIFVNETPEHRAKMIQSMESLGQTGGE